MSKKIILLCLFLSYSFVGIAQSDTTWQIGVVTAPSFYWKYNSFEFHTNGMNPISPDFPNSFIWGITLQKPLTERWNFKTGVEYSTQSQKFIGSTGASGTPTDNGEIIYTYTFNADHSLDISYLSIPLQFSYQIPIGTKEKWSFFTAQGLQISILTNYYGESKGYTLDPWTRERISLAGVIVQKPNEIYNASYPDYDDKTYYFTDTPAYRKFVLGYSSSYGFQRKLGERFTASLAVRFDFDFTNSDNVNGILNYNTTGLPTWDDDFSKDNRPVSHNIRLGVELGVRYSFGFKKRKPKVKQSIEIIEE
jgi:opacity protein-like surface antigen